jgi:hypothetical protein
MAASFWSSSHECAPSTPDHDCGVYCGSSREVFLGSRSWLAGKDKILSCNPNDRGYLSHDEIIKAKIYFCDGAITPGHWYQLF